MIAKNRLNPCRKKDKKSLHCILSVMSTTGDESTCPGGYWRAVTPESTCEPVGPGFFSPDNDSKRYPCLPGSFSSKLDATKCTLCSPGTYLSEPQSATECVACPRSKYSIDAGSRTCVPCNDLYYQGLASDYAIFLSAQQTGQE